MRDHRDETLADESPNFDITALRMLLSIVSRIAADPSSVQGAFTADQLPDASSPFGMQIGVTIVGPDGQERTIFRDMGSYDPTDPDAAEQHQTITQGYQHMTSNPANILGALFGALAQANGSGTAPTSNETPNVMQNIIRGPPSSSGAANNIFNMFTSAMSAPHHSDFMTDEEFEEYLRQEQE
jgi:hypothetical protein